MSKEWDVWGTVKFSFQVDKTADNYDEAVKTVKQDIIDYFHLNCRGNACNRQTVKIEIDAQDYID